MRIRYNEPLQVINYSEDTVVRLQLWDIAGQERFGNMTRVYYRYQQPRQSSSGHLQIFFRDAAAAFVVFDLTRRATFEAVRRWKEDLDSKVVTSDGAKVGHDAIGASVDSNFTFSIPQIPTILLANKSDLTEARSVSDDEVYRLYSAVYSVQYGD